MSKKMQKRVNGGLAIYFGIGSVLASIMLLIVILVAIYRDVFLNVNITSEIYLMFIGMFLGSTGMAYALLRIGYEEIEN